MLALELTDCQAGWTFNRADGKTFTIIRVIRFDDRVKLALNDNGDVSTQTLQMQDHVDVQPPARLTLPDGIAEDMPAAPECTHGADCKLHPGTGRVHNFDTPELLAGLDMGERNIIVSALQMFHRDALRQATQYGLEETIMYHVDPRHVSALLEKLRTDALANHARRAA